VGIETKLAELLDAFIGELHLKTAPRNAVALGKAPQLLLHYRGRDLLGDQVEGHSPVEAIEQLRAEKARDGTCVVAGPRGVAKSDERAGARSKIGREENDRVAEPSDPPVAFTQSAHRRSDPADFSCLSAVIWTTAV
jgi:hypothetical protein